MLRKTQRPTYVLEQRQHLIVRRVIRNKETKVGRAQHSRNTDQTRATTRNNSHILPGILALLALTMVLVVQMSNRLTEGLDAGSRAVLTAGHVDLDGLGPLEASLNLVFDLGSALAQVGPRIRVIEVAVLVGALRGPDDTCRRAGGVEAGVRLVAFVT